jgi:hypothetical protein
VFFIVIVENWSLSITSTLVYLHERLGDYPVINDFTLKIAPLLAHKYWTRLEVTVTTHYNGSELFMAIRQIIRDRI